MTEDESDAFRDESDAFRDESDAFRDDLGDDPSDVIDETDEFDDPFDELGPATDATDADLADAFERMDIGDLSEEDVWESLDEDAGGIGPVGEFGGAGAEMDATGADLGGEFGAGGRFDDAGVERVVSKRTYCQQCPHFSAPPDVACDHEGTTIVEAVGFDEFRVRNCPMVDDDDPTFDATRGE
ncbi:hypothetical protein [Halorubrum lipolyticum]|uniref:DUF8135 domain-containing protein n=1 Tax=Halorubrum lipolyticum DSM 21995 TaxID=1227482 RepID=M0NJP6_9EURY|nr:hypothetical protein [Halorubrum lipolyticum]EMA58207.1 hypothetical protein C469_13395 [Halorubrum lipolyticum DSM 21995]